MDDYQAGQKTKSGYLALPPYNSGQGVLVLHAWWGLNEFFVELCDRLASKGYVVLAPDFYGGAVATTPAEAEALMHASDSEATQQKALAALDFLRNYPTVQGKTVGVLGCSLGASWALQLSTLRPEQVGAAVLFYGVDNADFAAARCAYQGHFAENDEWDSVEQATLMADGMRAAGREVEFHVYPGVGHWFFEADRPDAYNAEAAELAWERTLTFLDQRLR